MRQPRVERPQVAISRLRLWGFRAFDVSLSLATQQPRAMSRLIAGIFSFWWTRPWFERQSSRFLSLGRTFRQIAVVPHRQWQNRNDSPVDDVLDDDETAVVSFAVDDAKAAIGCFGNRDVATRIHHFPEGGRRHGRSLTYPLLRVKCNPRASRAEPSPGEMNTASCA
jgi:hypothetical protein